jgi:hypothetical protein
MPQLEVVPFRLEPITLREYRNIETQWRDDKQIPEIDLCARLLNPIIAKTYEELFSRLVEFPYANRIHLRQGPKWRRFSVRGITPVIQRQLANIASNDVKKRNYLELLLGNGEKRGRIEFAEHKSKEPVIVGYKIHVLRDARDLFTTPPVRCWYRAVHALYDPTN